MSTLSVREIAPTANGPSFRLICCLLTAAFVAATYLFISPLRLLESDTYWHIKTGLDIMANGAVPHADAYSFTFLGHPWIAKEWLSQVLLALAYEHGGWNAVALIPITALTVTGAMLTWQLSRWLKPEVALAAAIISAALCSTIIVARPHIITLPIVVLWTGTLFAAARERRAPSPWLAIAIMLWANLHATFTVGFVIAAFAGLDFALRTRFRDWNGIARWVGFGVLSVLASLVNPYGIQAILATFTVMGGNEAVQYIGEWQPFSFNAGSTTDIVGLVGLIAGLILLKPKPSLACGLFIVMLLCMFLGSARFSYLLFLIAPLVLAPDVADANPALRAGEIGEQGSLHRAAERWPFRMSIGLAAFALLLPAAVMHWRPVQPWNEMYPKAAIDFAKREHLAGNVLNHYNFGGALVLEGIPTFIDGRTDQLFLNGFMNDSQKMRHAEGADLLRKAVAKYDIGWALVTPDDAKNMDFRNWPDWEQLYADDAAVIFARRRG